MAYYRHCYSIFTAVGLNFILSGSLHVFAGNVLLIITTHKSKISVGFLLNPPLTLILCLPPSWSDCQSTIQNWKNVFNCSISSSPSWIVWNQIPETWYSTWVWKGKAICRIERLVWKLRSISWMVKSSAHWLQNMNKMSSLLFYSVITPLIRQSMWKELFWTEDETINHFI